MAYGKFGELNQGSQNICYNVQLLLQRTFINCEIDERTDVKSSVKSTVTRSSVTNLKIKPSKKATLFNSSDEDALQNYCCFY